MNHINKCLEKLWDGPVTYVALFVVLMTISILVTGVGLHSAVVWIVLASASVLCLALCSCVKCRKRASRWRRTSEPSDTVSTISDANGFMHDILYTGSGGAATPYWRRDSLPDYSAVAGPDQLPPPYALVAGRPRTDAAPDAADAAPPPYDAVVNSTQILRVCVDVDGVTAPAPSQRVRNANKANVVVSGETTVVEMLPVDDRIIQRQPEDEENSQC